MTKRLIITIALALMIIGIPMVSEAKDKNVTISEAAVTETGLTVKGTTEAPAVMVQIRDGSDTIIAMSSFAVVDNAFSGSISQSLTAGSSYKIYIADYEGGEFAIQSVTVPQKSQESPSETDESDQETSDNSSSESSSSENNTSENSSSESSTSDNASSNSTSSNSTSSNSSSSGGSASGKGLSKKIVAVKMEYTVVKGDTMTKIARKLGVSLASLRIWNPNIKNINLIFTGQKIIYYVDKEVLVDANGNVAGESVGEEVTRGDFYVVQRGDNLNRIARKTGTTVEKLLKKNPIKNPNLIYPGQKIYY